MYNPDNDIEIRYSTKHLPIEYKLLEWRLIINRELYEDKVIDLEVFSEMEKSILGRMTKIRNEYKDISMTNYRDYNRKRIGFDFAYKLATHVAKSII